MKKTIFTLIFSTLIMTLICATASAAYFNDVSSSFWANKEITWANEKGLMNGTTTSTFNPTGKTLRGQMTAILYRYAGSPAVEQTSVYSDVTSANYYADAATWAVQNGIMVDDRLASKTMDAGEPISRAEFCTMLRNFALYTDRYVAPSPETAFTDIEGLDSEYAIIWANQNGIVNGTTTTTFNPTGTLTRAAAAAMLYRFENFSNPAVSDAYLTAKAKAEELANYYACVSPRIVEDLLITDYGFSTDEASYGVREADINDLWSLFAVTKAEEFFMLAPVNPTKKEVKDYLTGSHSFSESAAQHAINVADIDWTDNTSRSDDWISLTELENYGFSATAAWGAITLRYLTNVEYVITGLPKELYSGDSFYMYLNDEWIDVMYYCHESRPTKTPNENFYVSKYNLINAGLLAENGPSYLVKMGITQADLPIYVQDATYPDSSEPDYSGSSSSGYPDFVFPSHSTTTSGVWITQDGSKYHSRSGCSGMQSPIQVPREDAIAWGYSACKRCH